LAYYFATINYFAAHWTGAEGCEYLQKYEKLVMAHHDVAERPKKNIYLYKAWA
jgi:hypothetical protein